MEKKLFVRNKINSNWTEYSMKEFFSQCQEDPVGFGHAQYLGMAYPIVSFLQHAVLSGGQQLNSIST